MGVTEQHESRRVRTGISEGDLRPAPDWNLRELLERVDDDREFLCELLRIFREDSAANLQKAKTTLRERDLPGLMRVAHTMKGMLRNLSMDRAAEIACALETFAREQKREQAEISLSQLELALAELLPQIDAQLAGVRA